MEVTGLVFGVGVSSACQDRYNLCSDVEDRDRGAILASRKLSLYNYILNA